EVLRGEELGRGAARQKGAKRIAIAHAAGMFFENLPDGRAHRQLPRAWVFDPAAGAVDLSATVFALRQTAEPLGTAIDDVGHVGKGLDVVDDGGLAPKPADLGIGRLRPRDRAIALEGGEHRGLVAADIASRAPMQMELQVETRAQD